MLYWYGVFILSILVLVWAMISLVRHIRRHHALALEPTPDVFAQSPSHTPQD